MKKNLIPAAVKYYRANLHSHSNISDGKKSPEEMKEFYKKRGYSIIAFTDHDVFIPHNDLTDDEFLALNGYEMEVTRPKGPDDRGYIKTCHINLVALEPDNETPVCFHRTKYLFGNAVESAKRVKNDDSLPDYEREYSHECINDMIKKGREGGFFVTYNHPTWSMQDYSDYMGYEGMNAMEIANYSASGEAGFNEFNEHVYDDLLRSGKQLYCLATDDNHNHHPDYAPDSGSFGGYVMIGAESLDYRTVTKALENGDFYAVTGTATHDGPSIFSLVYDTESHELEITCSDAREINVVTDSRNADRVYAKENAPLNSAKVVLKPENIHYFRVEVIDKYGYKAYSNAYFIDKL